MDFVVTRKRTVASLTLVSSGAATDGDTLGVATGDAVGEKIFQA